MRFVDFIIVVCAIVTAGSTFAVAVELIFDWSQVWPEIVQLLRDWGLDGFLGLSEQAAAARL